MNSGFTISQNHSNCTDNPLVASLNRKNVNIDKHQQQYIQQQHYVQQQLLLQQQRVTAQFNGSNSSEFSALNMGQIGTNTRMESTMQPQIVKIEVNAGRPQTVLNGNRDSSGGNNKTISDIQDANNGIHKEIYSFTSSSLSSENCHHINPLLNRLISSSATSSQLSGNGNNNGKNAQNASPGSGISHK